MTDISNWPDLVRWYDDKPHYVSIPLSEYQMGNLVGALAQVANTGDWWGEFLNIIAVAMKKKGIKELSSNSGRIFSLEQIRSHYIRGDTSDFS